MPHYSVLKHSEHTQKRLGREQNLHQTEIIKQYLEQIEKTSNSDSTNQKFLPTEIDDSERDEVALNEIKQQIVYQKELIQRQTKTIRQHIQKNRRLQLRNERVDKSIQVLLERIMAQLDAAEVPT